MQDGGQPMNDTKAVDAMTYFGERGLEWWSTGGGCYAFGKNLDDEKSYVLVTGPDGLQPPAEGEEIVVGLYNDDGLFDGVIETATTFDEAMTKMNALIEKHVK
jgi:hypothetical protein